MGQASRLEKQLKNRIYTIFNKPPCHALNMLEITLIFKLNPTNKQSDMKSRWLHLLIALILGFTLGKISNIPQDTPNQKSASENSFKNKSTNSIESTKEDQLIKNIERWHERTSKDLTSLQSNNVFFGLFQKRWNELEGLLQKE